MGLSYARALDNRMFRTPPTATFPIIANGDPAYPGAPAKDEDPSYPLPNLYDRNRYRPWSTKYNSADGSMRLHVDMSGGSISAGAGGADKTVSAVALHAVRPFGSAGIGPAVNIR